MDYLLSKKELENKIYYLVKWTGKTHQKNTWESKHDIIKRGFESLVQDYEGAQESPKTTKKKPSAKKGEAICNNKIEKIRKIELGKLCINIVSEKVGQRPNWIYENSVTEIEERDNLQNKYRVAWETGAKTWEKEEILLKK